ncbi:hypothetical protein KAX02_08320 [candidate division WOR-3 bacterium]|nr:hypothetical protein [candidate division WOR-3 bacterium]
MKKLLMMLGFLILLFTSLSATNIFDGKIIFTSHDTAKDSLGYICIMKAGGVVDTVAEIDTLGNITLLGYTQIDSLQIGDEEKITKLDFGSNVFGDAKTADTVLISGATASDLYLITAKDSIPAGYWTTISKVDTLIINSSAAENDTPFIWWRFK